MRKKERESDRGRGRESVCVCICVCLCAEESGTLCVLGYLKRESVFASGKRASEMRWREREREERFYFRSLQSSFFIRAEA